MRAHRFIRTSTRVAVSFALTMAGLGAVFAISPSPADAAVLHLTTTSVDCPATATYGTSVTCTLTVRDVMPFVVKASPTGTVAITTLLNRLNTVGSPCTLVALTSTSSSCTIDVTPNATGTIAPIGTFSPTGNFILSFGADLLTSTSAPLIVTADDLSRDYGSANPTLTVGYSGFVLGDDSSDLSGTLACSTTATTSSPATDYPINCDGLTSADYDITFVDGTLTVDPAPLSITATNASRAYGHANPTFAVTYSGFVNGDDPTDLTGTLACTSTATTSSPATTYPITCGGLTSPDYAITSVPGTLTVQAVPLTITAVDSSRITDTPNPAFAVGYTGFVNGDTASNLVGTLVCATTAVTASAPGAYPITCTGLTSTNYTTSWLPGNLHVFAAPGAFIPGGGSSVPAGQNIVVDTGQWKPGTTVTVTACGVTLGTVTVDSNGEAHGSFAVPANTPPGPCDLVLAGTDLAGTPATVVLAITIVGSGALPSTGGNLVPMTLTGSLMLAIGAAFVLAGRRRTLVAG